MSRKKYFKPIAYLGLSVVVGGALFGTAAWGTETASDENIPDGGTAALSDSRQVFQDSAKYRDAIVKAIEDECNATVKYKSDYVSLLSNSSNFSAIPAKIKDSYDATAGYDAVITAAADCDFAPEKAEETLDSASDGTLKLKSPQSDFSNSYSMAGIKSYGENDSLYISVSSRPQLQGDEEAGIDEELKITEYIFTVSVTTEADNASLSEIPVEEESE